MDSPHSSFPHRHQASDPPQQRSFLSVSQAARILGMSQMTLYRAIHAGEFPAVRIRGRLIIPARALDEMVDAALADGRSVDAASWVPAQIGFRP